MPVPDQVFPRRDPFADGDRFWPLPDLTLFMPSVCVLLAIECDAVLPGRLSWSLQAPHLFVRFGTVTVSIA
jgi:hypothetical protein